MDGLDQRNDLIGNMQKVKLDFKKRKMDSGVFNLNNI